MQTENWQSEEDSLLSTETPLSQETGLSLSEDPNSYLPVDVGNIVSKANQSNDRSGFTSENTSNASSSLHNVLDVDYDELDKPWPTTLGRSMSLLAGPIMDTEFIDHITRSPKITPNISKRRESVNYTSPEPSRHLKGFNPTKYQHEFKQEMNKVKSLDFYTNDTNKRVLEANMYRQKLLEEAWKKKDKSHEIIENVELIKEKRTHNGQDDTNRNDKASFGQCAFNMANSLMGIGILALPFVFKSAGWIGGFLVTFIFSSVAWRTSILLGRELNGDPRPSWMFDDYHQKQLSSNSLSSLSTNQIVRMRKPLSSFPDIARSAFGPMGNMLLSSALYFELFSCLCIFFVTLGDHLHALFPSLSTKTHMIHVAFALAVPTALLRTPRLLSYLSAVGTFASTSIVLSVFGAAVFTGDISMEIAHKENLDVSSTHVLWKMNGLVIAFGLIAFTFAGHAIIPSIYTSMSNPKEYESMITFSFVVVTICCLLVAVSGYYMFGSLVDDQVTLSLEKHTGSDNILISMITWLMILTAFSKFTLSAFPLGLGIEECFARYISSDHVMEWISSTIKLILIVASLAVAIYIPSFSYLCSLVGLICTMIVSVIFPAAAHLKLFRARLPLWERVIDWTFIVAGTLITVVGTIQSTMS